MTKHLLTITALLFFTLSSCSDTRKKVEEAQRRQMLDYLKKEIKQISPKKASKEAKKLGKDVSPAEVDKYKKKAQNIIESLK